LLRVGLTELLLGNALIKTVTIFTLGRGLLRDRLCGQEVRVPGYRSRGPGFDSWRYQIVREVVGLERGPLSLVRIIEELLE
jgi:hypothetical protein